MTNSNKKKWRQAWLALLQETHLVADKANHANRATNDNTTTSPIEAALQILMKSSNERQVFSWPGQSRIKTQLYTKWTSHKVEKMHVSIKAVCNTWIRTRNTISFSSRFIMYGHGEKDPVIQLYTEFKLFLKKETNLKKEKKLHSALQHL